MDQFNTIDEALIAIRAGEMVIVVDDEERENEGDFVMAAEMVTPQAVNFMATHGRGIICAPLTAERAKALDLDYMVKQHDNNSPYGTPFTVSIDYIHDTTTGVSAHDRAKTFLALTDPSARAQDFMRPGHIFPLIARPGGVRERVGHTEAAVDLARLAGLQPCGAICEIMNADGSMARVPDLFAVARQHNLKLITIQALVQYLKTRQESQITKSTTTRLPTPQGEFTLHLYQERQSPERFHYALTMGPLTGTPLVRIHSECFTGDIFGSRRCDCGEQLHVALEAIAREGNGVVVYLKQEGRGIGAINKIKAYELQDQGHDTITANHQLGFESDERSYELAIEILKELGVERVRLMTNNPEKIKIFEQGHITLVERIPLEGTPYQENFQYLRTKKEKMGHLLDNIQ